MYQPFDKFISQIDVVKLISFSSVAVIKQVLIKDIDENFNMIELNLDQQSKYINLLDQIKKQNFNSKHLNDMLHIKIWSYDIQIKESISYYKFFFITEYFEQDFHSLILKKQKLNQLIDQQLLFGITTSLAELFKKLSHIKLPQNPINKQNIFIYEGHKAKYIPQTYFEEICNKNTKCKQQIQKIKISPLKKKNAVMSPKGFGAQTPRFDLEPIICQFKRSQSHLIKKESSNTRVRFNLNQIEVQKQNFVLPGYKQELDLQENRIYNYAVFLFEVSTLQDTNVKNKRKLQDLLDDIETKYGKLYMNFLKEMLDGEVKTWENVILKLKSIGKFKSSDDDREEDQKKSALNIKKTMNQTNDIQNELNIIQLPNKNLATGYKYLHFFPDDKNSVILVNITNLNNIFYEISQLNIQKPLPKQIHSIALPAVNEYKIYLIGGVFSNKVYLFDRNNTTLIEKKPLHSVDRTQFASCHICINQIIKEGKYIYVIGGKVDNQITNECECYNVLQNNWTKIADLNIPTSESCVCNYNDQYIYKFGGVNQFKKLSQDVEQYDIEKNQWRVIKIIQNQTMHYKFLKQSQCQVINQMQILIFGGKNEDNQVQDINVFFNVLDTGLTTIFELDAKTGFKLPLKWTLLNSTLLDERGIFCIQNGGYSNKNTLKVVYSGIYEWKTIKNIIF